MTRTILMIAVACFLAGCVSQTAVLVKDGQYLQCRNSGWGYIGAPVAASNQKKCIKKAEEAGYRLVTQP